MTITFALIATTQVWENYGWPRDPLIGPQGELVYEPRWKPKGGDAFIVRSNLTASEAAALAQRSDLWAMVQDHVARKALANDLVAEHLAGWYFQAYQDGEPVDA